VFTGIGWLVQRKEKILATHNIQKQLVFEHTFTSIGIEKRFSAGNILYRSHQNVTEDHYGHRMVHNWIEASPKLQRYRHLRLFVSIYASSGSASPNKKVRFIVSVP
jgi:hypothetical protein